jgi:hypothetical protein
MSHPGEDRTRNARLLAWVDEIEAMCKRDRIHWCEGCDLRRGPEVARIDFATPVLDAEAARAELVRLAALARGRA